MKKLLFTTILGTLVALGGQSALAETKKPTTTPAVEKAKPSETAKPKAEKAMPMHARADVIDVATKTFTQKTKDGKEVKNLVTDKTEIKNGDKPAKFEDIMVGDSVSGSRIKKSDTEYEVVKITKFGAEGKKPATTTKPTTTTTTKPDVRPKK